MVASLGSVAASGGYYVAVAATSIFANPGTLTGSIGVIMQLANFEGLIKKVGVDYVVVKAGRYKDIGNVRAPDDARGARACCRRCSTTCTASSSRPSPRAVVSARSASARWRTGGCTRDGGEAARARRRSRGTGRGNPPAGELGGVPGKPRIVRPRRTWRLLDLADLAGGESAVAWLRSLGWPGSGLPALPSFGSAKLPLYLLD